MKIRALKSIAGDYGFLKRGDEAEIADGTAKELITLGDVEQVDAPADNAEGDAPKKGKPDGKSKD